MKVIATYVMAGIAGMLWGTVMGDVLPFGMAIIATLLGAAMIGSMVVTATKEWRS